MARSGSRVAPPLTHISTVTLEESIVDIEDITEKYTGQRLGWADLTAAWRGGDPIARMLAHAVQRAACAVGEADADLGRAATSISDALADTRQALDALAGQPIRCLNPLGELQANGFRFDALVAARHDRIGHLRTVARLWQQLHATLAPPAPDLTQALTALGFEPDHPGPFEHPRRVWAPPRAPARRRVAGPVR